jgi:8-oxo-dGTP diphosphatase
MTQTRFCGIVKSERERRKEVKPMSRKNHKMIDGRLLQTDKKYSQLKIKQKEKIAEWMFQATRDYYIKKCTFPNDKHLEEVVDSVYERIEDAEIWIPYGEVFKHYKSKRSDINKRVRKSLNEKEESRIEKVCFMNMCMIQDDKGNVLVLDKVNDSYTGTTFPGGHVEANEIFQKSMIREVWEETGLTIEVPKLGGLYHWHKSGVHYVITLYKANKFTGELKSSEEGRVYWIPLEELKTRELATGTEHVLQILESEQVSECYMHLESDGYVGDLY